MPSSDHCCPRATQLRYRDSSCIHCALRAPESENSSCPHLWASLHWLPFFSNSCKRSLLAQVILAPIIEPPSQTGQEEGFSETPQYALLNEAFGYMNTGGYCATVGVCKNFPLMPEIGSPMTSINDNLMMGSLFNYMNSTGLGKHK